MRLATGRARALGVWMVEVFEDGQRFLPAAVGGCWIAGGLFGVAQPGERAGLLVDSSTILRGLCLVRGSETCRSAPGRIEVLLMTRTGRLRRSGMLAWLTGPIPRSLPWQTWFAKSAHGFVRALGEAPDRGRDPRADPMQVQLKRAVRDARAGGGHRVVPAHTSTVGEERLLRLQRLAGNQAVARMVAPTVQRVLLPHEVTATIESMGELYPRIEEGAHSALGPAADQFWQRHLRGQGLDDVVRQLLLDHLTDHEKTTKIRVTVYYTVPDAKKRPAVGIKVSQFETKPDDPDVTVSQWFEEDAAGRLVAEIRDVFLPARGRDAMRTGLLPLFSRLGVTKVVLTASSFGGLTSGKFAWARYGFVPVPAAWEEMRARAWTDLETNYRHKDWYDEAHAVVESSDPRMLRRLILLSWQNADPAVKTYLNTVVLGWDWKGEIDLDNPQDRMWIHNYVNQAAAARFVNLIPDRPTGDCVII